MVLCTRYCIR